MTRSTPDGDKDKFYASKDRDPFLVKKVDEVMNIIKKKKMRDLSNELFS